MNYVTFIYEKEGKPYGFAKTQQDYWVQKLNPINNNNLCVILNTARLKTNLKRLLKEKVAKKVEAGTTKGVAVPETMVRNLLV